MGKRRSFQSDLPFNNKCIAVLTDSELQRAWVNRLNESANLRREIEDLLDRWVAAESEAIFARWLYEHRPVDEALSTVRLKKLGDLVGSPPMHRKPALCASERVSGKAKLAG